MRVFALDGIHLFFELFNVLLKQLSHDSHMYRAVIIFTGTATFGQDSISSIIVHDICYLCSGETFLAYQNFDRLPKNIYFKRYISLQIDRLWWNPSVSWFHKSPKIICSFSPQSVHSLQNTVSSSQLSITISSASGLGNACSWEAMLLGTHSSSTSWVL